MSCAFWNLPAALIGFFSIMIVPYLQMTQRLETVSYFVAFSQNYEKALPAVEINNSWL